MLCENIYFIFAQVDVGKALLKLLVSSDVNTFIEMSYFCVFD